MAKASACGDNSLKLVVGLGNPGAKYRDTYHNLGFWAVDSICEQFNADVTQHELGWLMRCEEQSPLDYAAKPNTYVNRSGAAVSAWLGELGLEPHEILVIYDDLDLDVGRLRIRSEGSAGGHRGMQSIIKALKTKAIPRLRVGIGPTPTNMSGRDFVLSKITNADREIYTAIFAKMPSIVKLIAEQGIKKAMDSWNGVDFS